MSPCLTDSSYVLVVSPWNFLLNRKPILCFQHKHYGKIVKRLKSSKNDYFWFDSDSSEGISSAQIGPITKEKIIGRVLIILRR
jgi:hypothetical protein|tara:strand:+ start:600 stop:848 length:249 start_codon:yes stop_codon:yes gene_type:complete